MEALKENYMWDLVPIRKNLVGCTRVYNVNLNPDGSPIIKIHKDLGLSKKS